MSYEINLAPFEKDIKHVTIALEFARQNGVDVQLAYQAFNRIIDRVTIAQTALSKIKPR